MRKQFALLNNLTNISFLPEYVALCGITEEEIGENFLPELEKMAEMNEWTLQQTHDHLKDYYDGYHFSRRNMVDIYNPFSLIHALRSKELNNFWATSGATSLLLKFVDNMELRLRNFENCPILRQTLEECVLPALTMRKEAAVKQIIDNQYMEPFKADKHEVIGLGIELDENGKGLLDGKRAE